MGFMRMRSRLFCVLMPLLLFSQTAPVIHIAKHEARFDSQGRLLPWIACNAALEREMQSYQQCPAARGYPRFISVTLGANCDAA